MLLAERDYFIHKTIYSNFTVTTKHESRAEIQTWKEETEKNIRETHETRKSIQKPKEQETMEL